MAYIIQHHKTHSIQIINQINMHKILIRYPQIYPHLIIHQIHQILSSISLDTHQIILIIKHY